MKLTRGNIFRITYPLVLLTIWGLAYAGGLYGLKGMRDWTLILASITSYIVIIAILLGVRNVSFSLNSNLESKLEFILGCILDFLTYFIIILHQITVVNRDSDLPFYLGISMLFVTVVVLRKIGQMGSSS